MRWNNTERGVSFHSSTQDETFEERGGGRKKNEQAGAEYRYMMSSRLFD